MLCHPGGSFYSFVQGYKELGSFQHPIPSTDVYSKEIILQWLCVFSSQVWAKQRRSEKNSYHIDCNRLEFHPSDLNCVQLCL